MKAPKDNYLQKVVSDTIETPLFQSAREDFQQSLTILSYVSSELRDRVSGLEAELTRLTAALDAERQERDRLADLLTDHAALSEALRQERDRLTGLLTDQITQLEVLRRNSSQLQSALSDEISQSNALRHSLQTMLSSTSWQITRHLRAALERWPRLRRMLRRLLKLIWWTFSFQLIARVRARRQIASQNVIAAQPVSALHKDAEVELLKSEAEREKLSCELKNKTHEINRSLSREGLTVSIIIPCFNYGCYVEEAVQSALNQIYPHVRVIVVDDGSTDENTIRTVARLRSERVKTVFQPNQGLSSARNAGANESVSDFLMFLDADDVIDPTAVTLMLWCLLRHPEASYVYSSQHFFGDEEIVWDVQQYNGFDLLWSNHPSVCSLIRREAFESTGGYSPGMVVGFEDWNHWIMLLARGHYGTRILAPLFKHRLHGRTMTHKAVERQRLLHRKMRSHSPELYRTSRIESLKHQWRPAVSVIIPFFNMHDFIDETLASVRNQTIHDYEIVIVDDGSDHPDSISHLERLRRDSEVDPRISIVMGEHRGAPSARNRGVQQARSEFIFFLDGDDLLSPTALEKFILAATLHPHSTYFYCAVRHFGAVNGIACDYFDAGRLKRENFLPVSCLVRRTAYLEIGGMDENLLDSYEDYDLWLRLLSEGHVGMLIPEVLFHYRRHSHGYRTDLENKATSEAMYARLIPRHPKLFGGPQPDRTNWRLVESPKSDEQQSLLEGLLAKVHPSSIPRASYRRPCVPNVFSPDRWNKKNTRILYLVPYFLCGGAEQVDLDILKGFSERGFEVTLVACQDADHVWLSRFQALIADTFVLQYLTPDPEARNRILNYLMISRAIDIVFIRNTSLGYSLCERWQHISRNVAFVDLLHLHAFGEDWVRHSAIFHDLLTQRFVITRELKQYAVSKYALDPEKFEVIHNGISPAEFLSKDQVTSERVRLCSELKIEASASVVGFCGRVTNQKDPLRWLRSVALVLTARPDVQPIVIGDGDLLETMKKEARDIGLGGRVKFLGYREDARTILSVCDVLLLTSRYEGLPQVILEALASGVPVVATDVGGTREGVNDHVGALLDSTASDQEIADAVLRMIETVHLRSEIREACRRYVGSEFNVARQQTAYCNRITQLAQSLSVDQRLEEYMDYVMAGPLF